VIVFAAIRMDVPQPRKSLRLASRNYRGRQRYFVTMCCVGRRRVFEDSENCKLILDLLQSESATRAFAVLAYCAMPDHLHVLIEGLEPGSDLLGFLKGFKIKSSRWFARKRGAELWQRGYYEHVLREGEAVEAVAWYIWLNPVRKGLAARPEEYPFSGSFSGMKMPVIWAKAD
jgi:putative transposase